MAQSTNPDKSHGSRSLSPMKGKKGTSRNIFLPQLAYPVKCAEKGNVENSSILVKETFSLGYKRVDPEKLVREKPRKNKYCLPTEKEMQRRKDLNAEFDRMHNLAQETCDWLVTHGFPVTNNDRRNLAALMKTCFDPLPFSSIGKKPKEVFLVAQERDVAISKSTKLSEKERFGHLMNVGNVGFVLRDYIKKRKDINSKIIESVRLPENHKPEENDEGDDPD